MRISMKRRFCRVFWRHGRLLIRRYSM